MSAKFSQPYQSLLLRILHSIIGLFTIAAMITAYWLYDFYDGRWGKIDLPQITQIKDFHGVSGSLTSLIFPLFFIYAFHQGQQKLIQSNSINKLNLVGRPIWWYTLHRFVNTLNILILAIALLSGRMMQENWLPEGELNHTWYYIHLASWLFLLICLSLHTLISVKVGGLPLISSMIHWRFRSKDHPKLWLINLSQSLSNFKLIRLKQWRSFISLPKITEIIILVIILFSWAIPITEKIKDNF